MDLRTVHPKNNDWALVTFEVLEIDTTCIDAQFRNILGMLVALLVSNDGILVRFEQL